MVKYNPFNPNSVVIPNLFAGRYQQINNICKKLAQVKNGMPASFFLYGERGIGKTALAKLVKFIAEAKDSDLHNLNFLTSYYAVEEGQNFSSVLQESMNRLTDNIERSLVEKIGARVGRLFKNGKFEIGAFGFSVGVGDQVQEEITVKDQTVSILSNIFKVLGEQAVPAKDGILIIIDETHNLKDISIAASVIRNIITTLDVDNLGKISFLLIGYHGDLETFFSRDPSAKRTFDMVELGVMPSTEATEVLKKGFVVAGVGHDPKALDSNIAVAGGYPHSIQIIGHELLEGDMDNSINDDDWKRALLSAAMELRTKEFSVMYSFGKKLTLRDDILALLAKEDRPFTKKELQNLTGKNVYQYIPDLKKIGAIKEDSDGKIILHSQLFRTAVRIDSMIREFKK